MSHKKKLGTLLALCTMLLSALGMTRYTYASEDVVQESDFSDPYFYQAMVDRFDTDKNGLIERSEADAAISFIIYSDDKIFEQTDGITGLDGIENFPNLETFMFSAYKYKLTDIEPLAQMTSLKNLYIEGEDQIKDYSPLKNLVNLEVLELRNTNVSDISFLQYMPKLQQLDFFMSLLVTDTEVLANLTELNRVVLDETGVANIKGLANLTKLEFVSLQGTLVTDFENLYNSAETLTWLTAGGYNRDTGILRLTQEDVQSLTELKSLKMLSIMSSYLNEIPDLSSMTELEDLCLHWNFLTMEDIENKIPQIIINADGWIEKTGMDQQYPKESYGEIPEEYMISEEKLGISVSGQFESDVYIECEIVDNSNHKEVIEDMCEDEAVDKVEIYDINILKEITFNTNNFISKRQPQRLATVSIPFDSKVEIPKRVLREEKDGSFTELKFSVANEKINIETEHFSIFSIAFADRGDVNTPVEKVTEAETTVANKPELNEATSAVKPNVSETTTSKPTEKEDMTTDVSFESEDVSSKEWVTEETTTLPEETLVEGKEETTVSSTIVTDDSDDVVETTSDGEGQVDSDGNNNSNTFKIVIVVVSILIIATGIAVVIFIKHKK